MERHQDAVGAEVHVGFEVAIAERHSVFERRHRVLGRLAGTAPMSERDRPGPVEIGSTSRSRSDRSVHVSTGPTAAVDTRCTFVLRAETRAAERGRHAGLSSTSSRRVDGQRSRAKCPLVPRAHRERTGDRRGHRAVPTRRVADGWNPAGSAPLPRRRCGYRLRRASSGSRSRVVRLCRIGRSSNRGRRTSMASESCTAGSSTPAYGSGLSFRDPDNLALEFFAPPG